MMPEQPLKSARKKETLTDSQLDEIMGSFDDSDDLRGDPAASSGAAPEVESEASVLATAVAELAESADLLKEALKPAATG